MAQIDAASPEETFLEVLFGTLKGGKPAPQSSRFFIRHRKGRHNFVYTENRAEIQIFPAWCPVPEITCILLRSKWVVGKAFLCLISEMNLVPRSLGHFFVGSPSNFAIISSCSSWLS
jgi:hypothetical protein